EAKRMKAIVMERTAWCGPIRGIVNMVIVEKQTRSAAKSERRGRKCHRMSHVENVIPVNLGVRVSCSKEVDYAPSTIMNRIVMNRPVRAGHVESSNHRIVTKTSVAGDVHVQICDREVLDCAVRAVESGNPRRCNLVRKATSIAGIPNEPVSAAVDHKPRMSHAERDCACGSARNRAGPVRRLQNCVGLEPECDWTSTCTATLEDETSTIGWRSD